MPFPGTSDFTAPDRDLLAHFLRAVYELLAEVTEVPFDPLKQPLFADELIDPMRGAFSEVRDHFGRLDAAIKELVPERMAEHGLSGNQLRFKLATVKYREQKYRQRGGLFRFRWLLDTIEGLLDSIIDAAGVGGAIKDFKEAVRSSGNDDE